MRLNRYKMRFNRYKTHRFLQVLFSNKMLRSKRRGNVIIVEKNYKEKPTKYIAL